MSVYNTAAAVTVERQDEHGEKKDMFTDKRVLRLVMALKCTETYSNTHFNKKMKRLKYLFTKKVCFALYSGKKVGKNRINPRTAGIKCSL